VLGSAAGGGVLQWNCRCAVCRLAWAGDPRVKTRTQSSLAVSPDGAHWLLVNASPDLRQQIATTPCGEPMTAAFAQVDASAASDGLLSGFQLEADFALDDVKRHATPPELQPAVLDALSFAYVEPALPPPGAWTPGAEPTP
jgi:hypothetical protein